MKWDLKTERKRRGSKGGITDQLRHAWGSGLASSRRRGRRGVMFGRNMKEAEEEEEEQGNNGKKGQRMAGRGIVRN